MPARCSARRRGLAAGHAATARPASTKSNVLDLMDLFFRGRPCWFAAWTPTDISIRSSRRRPSATPPRWRSISRSAIVIGKCLGGGGASTFQGIIFLALAGLAHVPYDPILILTIIGKLLLLAFKLTAFGVMMAARITQIQAFMALTQMLVVPLFFLSGALYPLRGLPARLGRAHPVRPITYVV